MRLNEYIRTDNDKSIILIRFLVGVVFLAEGLQKFIYPGLRGPGRFESIGIPFPEFSGSIFLWIKGGGYWSVDFRIQNNN
jgi:putative oxidoreductase